MSAQLVYRRLSELREWDGNPKLHHLEKLVASFKKYGFTGPLLVNGESGVILAGHSRNHALRAIQGAGEEPPVGILLAEDGQCVVPVWEVAPLDEAKGQAYALDDNFSTMAGGGLGFEDIVKAFDREKLKGVLEELVAAEEMPVFADRAAVELLLGDEGLFSLEAALAAAIEPRIARGEIWALGRHRLLCGDATDASDVKRLVGDEEVVLMVTDPPYGVGLDHGWRRLVGGGLRSVLRATGIEGDDRADWREVWKLWRPQVLYVFHAADRAHEVREGLELPKGYDRRHAHQDLARYLAQRKRAYDAGVELEREIALERCHELLRRVWPRAKRGHWRDVREARLLVERILELEGMRGKAGYKECGKC